jgi:hypothetical protein
MKNFNLNSNARVTQLAFAFRAALPKLCWTGSACSHGAESTCVGDWHARILERFVRRNIASFGVSRIRIWSLNSGIRQTLHSMSISPIY